MTNSKSIHWIEADPLEGTTICAKNLPNALCVIALNSKRRPAERAWRLYGQDRHRPRLSDDWPWRLAVDNIIALAKAKGVAPSDISACIMDRPRHARLIAEVLLTGAAIRLIGDGDVAGVIHTIWSAQLPGLISISASAVLLKAFWRLRWRCAALPSDVG